MIRRLILNTCSNLGQLVVYLVVTFIMAPFYLRMLGHHDYGLREMILSLIGYMGLLDLGLRPTVSRFAAMYNAREDRDSQQLVYTTSLVFMGVVGLLLAVFFWLWALSYPQMLVPEGSTGVKKYVLFLLLVGAQMVFLFPRFVVESLLEGLQRYYLKNMINILSTILLAVLSYLYMTPDNALVLFAFLVAVFTVVRLLLFMVMLWRPAVGHLYPAPAYFSPAKLLELLHFGAKSFIQGAAHTMETMSDRLVIGTILGPASVPVYSIPQSLVSYMSNITTTLTHAFMPLFSDLNARNEQQRMQAIYLLASKLVVGLVLPMAVGISLIGGPFVDIWMHGAFDRATVQAIIILLALYVTVPNLNPFASRYLTAINRHGFIARVAPVAALANLVLSIVFVMKYGPIGAALGSVFPVFIKMPIILLYACRHLGVGFWHYVRNSLLPPLLPLFLMAGAVLWIRLDRGLNSYPDILVAVLTGAVVYGGAFLVWSLDRDERSWLLGFVRSGRRTAP